MLHWNTPHTYSSESNTRLSFHTNEQLRCLKEVFLQAFLITLPPRLTALPIFKKITIIKINDSYMRLGSESSPSKSRLVRHRGSGFVMESFLTLFMFLSTLFCGISLRIFLWLVTCDKLCAQFGLMPQQAAKTSQVKVVPTFESILIYFHTNSLVWWVNFFWK